MGGVKHLGSPTMAAFSTLKIAGLVLLAFLPHLASAIIAAKEAVPGAVIQYDPQWQKVLYAKGKTPSARVIRTNELLDAKFGQFDDQWTITDDSDTIFVRVMKKESRGIIHKLVKADLLYFQLIEAPTTNAAVRSTSTPNTPVAATLRGSPTSTRTSARPTLTRPKTSNWNIPSSPRANGSGFTQSQLTKDTVLTYTGTEKKWQNTVANKWTVDLSYYNHVYLNSDDGKRLKVYHHEMAEFKKNGSARRRLGWKPSDDIPRRREHFHHSFVNRVIRESERQS